MNIYERLRVALEAFEQRFEDALDVWPDDLLDVPVPYIPVERAA